MPIILIIPPYVMSRDLAMFGWVTASMRESFRLLGGRLSVRQLDLARMVDETASIPVLRFEGDAVTAMLDSSQYGALTVTIPDSLQMDVSKDRAQTVFGLGRIPAGYDAGMAIPGLLKAMAALTEHVGRSVQTKATDKFATAYVDFMSHPSSPMVQALIQTAPRFARSVGSIIQTLADFLNMIGSDEGSRFRGFATGLGALMEALARKRELDEANKNSKNAKNNKDGKGTVAVPTEPTNLVELARDAGRYIGLALVGIPWLGAYLPTLFRTITIGVRLLALTAVEKIERQVWDLRKSILKLFYVDLEVFRRLALSYLESVQKILLSQFKFYSDFIDLYLYQLGVNLVEWGKKLTEMFAKIIDYIRYFAIVVGALGDALLPPGSNFVADALAVSPPPPRPFKSFPNLSETMFGSGMGERLLKSVRSGRELGVKLVFDILGTSVELMNKTASGFSELRDFESRDSVAQRLSSVMSEGEARVQDLMGPVVASMHQQQPYDLGGLAGPFEAALAPPGAAQAPFGSALAAGGFMMLGTAIPRYVKGLRDFWLRERSTGQRPTSPHLLAKRARHLQVHMPELTIKATGRPTDSKLATMVAETFRTAIDDAYRIGKEKFLVAPAG